MILVRIYIVIIHNAAYQIMAFNKVEPITTANKDEIPYAITPQESALAQTQSRKPFPLMCAYARILYGLQHYGQSEVDPLREL